MTAPLATSEDLIITDNLPMVIPDPVEVVEEKAYSIFLDPIVPFLLVGIATFVAMIITAFVLTAPIA